MISNIITLINNDFDKINNPLILFILLSFFIGATYTDLKYMKIYNKFNLAFLIIRILLIFSPIYALNFTFSHLMGAIIGFSVLIIPAIALMHKMGGDIKFISILGLYLGTPLIILLLIISCLTMLMFSLIKKLSTKENIKKKLVPFAPFFFISFISIYLINLLI